VGWEPQKPIFLETPETASIMGKSFTPVD